MQTTKGMSEEGGKLSGMVKVNQEELRTHLDEMVKNTKINTRPQGWETLNER